MGFLRQEYWSGLPFPSPGNLPDPGIEPRSLTLQADSLPSEPPAKPIKVKWALRVEHWTNTFSVFMKGNTREFSLFLCVSVSFILSLFPSPTPCVRTHGEASLGRKNSYQNLTLLAPWSETSSPQTVRKYISVVYSTESIVVFYGILGWQIETHLFQKFTKENEWKEIENVISLLRNLWDFTKWNS